MKRSLKALSNVELLEHSKKLDFLLEANTADVLQKTSLMLTMLDSEAGKVQGSESLEAIRKKIVDQLKLKLKGAKPDKQGKLAALFSKTENERAAAMEAVFFIKKLNSVFRTVSSTVLALGKSTSQPPRELTNDSQVSEVFSDEEDSANFQENVKEMLVEPTETSETSFRKEADWFVTYGGDADETSQEIMQMTLGVLKKNLANLKRLAGNAPEGEDVADVSAGQNRRARTPRGQDIDLNRMMRDSKWLKDELGITDENKIELWTRLLRRIANEVGDSGAVRRIFNRD